MLSLRGYLEAALREQTEKPVHIEILADVLEIAEAEEHWRRAVEGYLNTQKFYLLVAPEYYSDTLRIFNQVKHTYGSGSFGIVDIGKLREREHIEPLENSLAKKVETENGLARSYIDYLLGRVVCCSHVDQLRQFKTSITADGMLYQGYVARPIRKELMDDAFIGHRAVALRISRIEAEIKDIEDTLRIWNPVYQTLDQFGSHDVLFTARFVQNTVAQRQTDYLRGIEITKELEQIIENKTNYDEYLLSELTQGTLAVYHGGFLSPQKKKLFQKLGEAVQSNCDVFFWADIDLGGFQMFAQLQRLIPSLKPLRMSGSDVDKYHANGLVRPESYLDSLKSALVHQEYPLFADAIQEILKYGVTIEQEAFLLT